MQPAGICARVLYRPHAARLLRLGYKLHHVTLYSSNKSNSHKSSQHRKRVYRRVLIIGNDNLSTSLDSGTCCVKLLQCANYISVNTYCSIDVQATKSSH